METQKISFCLALMLSIMAISSRAQDTAKVNRSKPEVLSSLQLQRLVAYKVYADSAKKTVSRISIQYKRDIDSLLHDQQIDGKMRWEKLNELNRRRNKRISTINDSLRVRYASIRLKS